MSEVADQIAIPAAFIRGGTSKAIFFRRELLPADREDWADIFLAAMGTPDPNGRQLDGMGGGLSSLSKVCVVELSQRDGIDVDYTFVQVSIKDRTVSYTGNCGNISSAVGPYAVDEGLVTAADGVQAVTLFNTNTKKTIRESFEVRGGRAAVNGRFELPGVAGTGSPVQMEFLEPGGAATGRLFPTGAMIDRFEVPGHASVRVSVVDAANLCCFAMAEDLGLLGTEMPAWLDTAKPVHVALNAIREQAEAAVIAAAPAGTTPPGGGKPFIGLVGFVSPPAEAQTLAGEPVHAADCELTGRMFSSGQPHRALPLTATLCMSVAAMIPGTTVNQVARPRPGAQGIRIATPSGVMTVTADVVQDGGHWRATSASVFRTQRRLFDGRVYVRHGAEEM